MWMCNHTFHTFHRAAHYMHHTNTGVNSVALHTTPGWRQTHLANHTWLTIDTPGWFGSVCRQDVYQAAPPGDDSCQLSAPVPTPPDAARSARLAFASFQPPGSINNPRTHSGVYPTSSVFHKFSRQISANYRLSSVFLHVQTITQRL